MNKLYEKSEVGFSILWIVIYVVGTSLADGLSVAIGIEKLLTSIFHIVLSAVVLIWIKKQGFFEKYGGSRILAVEPDRRNFRKLTENNSVCAAFRFIKISVHTNSCYITFGKSIDGTAETKPFYRIKNYRVMRNYKFSPFAVCLVKNFVGDINVNQKNCFCIFKKSSWNIHYGNRSRISVT